MGDLHASAEDDLFLLADQETGGESRWNSGERSVCSRFSTASKSPTLPPRTREGWGNLILRTSCTSMLTGGKQFYIMARTSSL
jgi:hypothetical protein